VSSAYLQQSPNRLRGQSGKCCSGLSRQAASNCHERPQHMLNLLTNAGRRSGYLNSTLRSIVETGAGADLPP
jgi:hypothetical protein